MRVWCWGALWFFVALLPAGVVGEEAGVSKRLNVLLICIDDLRPELGCYGVADAQSPRLDQFAREGVLFTNHFVAVPTCGASRYALLTGRAPWRSGVTRNNNALYGGKSAIVGDETLPAATLPELFRRNGYHTTCIGKVSHTADGKVYAYNGEGDGRPELPFAWDELATPYGAWKRGWGIFFAYAGGRHREDGQGHHDLLEFAVERDVDLPDGMLADAAIEALTGYREKDEPFFLGLGFFKPHLPFVATQDDWDAIDEESMVLPEHRERPETAYWHGSGEFFRYAMPFEKQQPLTDEGARQARRGYLACVRYTDRQVGKVLDALDELGLAESTVVVVWGDHGWHLGESSLWGKHSPHERALRSALMIRAPGVSKAGLKQDGLTETIDLYPTLVDLCELPEQSTRFPLDGASLRPLLAERDSAVRQVSISTWGDATSIRSASHRLIVRKGQDGWQDVELYDLADGPDPVRNLAEDEPELVESMLELASQRLGGDEESHGAESQE